MDAPTASLLFPPAPSFAGSSSAPYPSSFPAWGALESQHQQLRFDVASSPHADAGFQWHQPQAIVIEASPYGYPGHHPSSVPFQPPSTAPSDEFMRTVMAMARHDALALRDEAEEQEREARHAAAQQGPVIDAPPLLMSMPVVHSPRQGHDYPQPHPASPAAPTSAFVRRPSAPHPRPSLLAAAQRGSTRTSAAAALRRGPKAAASKHQSSGDDGIGGNQHTSASTNHQAHPPSSSHPFQQPINSAAAPHNPATHPSASSHAFPSTTSSSSTTTSTSSTHPTPSRAPLPSYPTSTSTTDSHMPLVNVHVLNLDAGPPLVAGRGIATDTTRARAEIYKHLKRLQARMADAEDPAIRAAATPPHACISMVAGLTRCMAEAEQYLNNGCPQDQQTAISQRLLVAFRSAVRHVRPASTIPPSILSAALCRLFALHEHCLRAWGTGGAEDPGATSYQVREVLDAMAEMQRQACKILSSHRRQWNERHHETDAPVTFTQKRHEREALSLATDTREKEEAGPRKQLSLATFVARLAKEKLQAFRDGAPLKHHRPRPVATSSNPRPPLAASHSARVGPTTTTTTITATGNPSSPPLPARSSRPPASLSSSAPSRDTRSSSSSRSHPPLSSSSPSHPSFSYPSSATALHASTMHSPRGGVSGAYPRRAKGKEGGEGALSVGGSGKERAENEERQEEKGDRGDRTSVVRKEGEKGVSRGGGQYVSMSERLGRQMDVGARKGDGEEEQREGVEKQRNEEVEEHHSHGREDRDIGMPNARARWEARQGGGWAAHVHWERDEPRFVSEQDVADFEKMEAEKKALALIAFRKDLAVRRAQFQEDKHEEMADGRRGEEVERRRGVGDSGHKEDREDQRVKGGGEEGARSEIIEVHGGGGNRGKERPRRSAWDKDDDGTESRHEERQQPFRDNGGRSGGGVHSGGGAHSGGGGWVDRRSERRDSGGFPGSNGDWLPRRQEADGRTGGMQATALEVLARMEKEMDRVRATWFNYPHHSPSFAPPPPPAAPLPPPSRFHIHPPHPSTTIPSSCSLSSSPHTSLPRSHPATHTNPPPTPALVIYPPPSAAVDPAAAMFVPGPKEARRHLEDELSTVLVPAEDVERIQAQARRFRALESAAAARHGLPPTTRPWSFVERCADELIDEMMDAVAREAAAVCDEAVDRMVEGELS